MHLPLIPLFSVLALPCLPLAGSGPDSAVLPITTRQQTIRPIALPLGTLAANVIGGYLIGIAVALFHLNTHFPLAWKLFAITGILGGLTTFSTFSAEVVERLLAGQPLLAIGLASVHLAGSLLATYVGLLTLGATRIWS